MPIQGGWRRCTNCTGLFYNGNAAVKGRCPATGGGHVADAPQLGVYFDSGPAPTQADWLWCRHCFGLFFGPPHPDGGYLYDTVCPATMSGHDPSGSLPYFVELGERYLSGQRGWAQCTRCRGLFYPMSSGGNVCPAGGPHTSAGVAYTVTFESRWSLPLSLNFDWLGKAGGDQLHFLVGVTDAAGQPVRGIQTAELAMKQSTDGVFVPLTLVSSMETDVPGSYLIRAKLEASASPAVALILTVADGEHIVGRGMELFPPGL